MKFQARTMVKMLSGRGAGAGFQRENGIGLNGILRRIARNIPTTVPAKKGPRKYGSPPTKLTDDQVREIRRHFERDMWSREKICLTYGLPRDYLQQLLSYQVRSKVLP